MKRSWNVPIWAGFVVALAAALSYIPIFARFPSTRDVPWVNLLLFLVAGILLGVGLKRAYGQPERYRGKVSGVVFGVLTFALFALFCVGSFFFARQLPSSSAAPQVGQQAPDFTLNDASGQPVSLSGMLKDHKAVLLVFYRGYW